MCAQAKRELDRHATSLHKLAAEKETLTGELSRQAVALQQAEREGKQQADLIAALRSEKSQLEAALYEAHQALGSCSALLLWTLNTVEFREYCILQSTVLVDRPVLVEQYTKGFLC